ncbi:SH3 domain-binding glutamic acid-rich-like protein 3 [Acipenser oxyrinchus oxyrinchus]|uniref:SH3 domain-binding glutamic acid-rich-like protein 3 n=1 Tax=Acipenser oxyrinchus oxyrinchus TaxID=40147 RepID=A0AAD8DJC8_ACIOX|nr:SH3 domain-binding glutamic acid-rich-like protein 3 [Acipenser oxyrinchus oxyrinchus]
MFIFKRLQAQMSKTVQVYICNVTPSRNIRSMQAEVTRILEASKIPFELIDIASGETLLEEMRSKTSNPSALPPQIFNNDVYCGDYYQLHEATENGELLQFLRL